MVQRVTVVTQQPQPVQRVTSVLPEPVQMRNDVTPKQFPTDANVVA